MSTEGFHMQVNCFPYIAYSFLPAFTLTHAPGQAWYLGNPKTAFSMVNERLPHVASICFFGFAKSGDRLARPWRDEGTCYAKSRAGALDFASRRAAPPDCKLLDGTPGFLAFLSVRD